MKGDFTKFRFDPAKRFTRVLKQQGRVDLDSDWNEYNEIENYIERTTRIDTLGHYGVPVEGGGFGVGFNGADLTFTAGRLYVEGIQCELFVPTTYLGQPFLPNPPALAPADGQTDAVFLDVWERYITGVEDPSIVEIALGGPDTTTRVQTVFQIRVTPNVGAITCPKMPMPAASGGQMTPSVVPAPPSDDPCLLAPTGGYRGLENRLYRIEIHDPGDLNAATFKWSRDNGSIVFPITEFATGQPTKIRVTRLGRDQVLAIRFGDWVEVLGDQSEWSATPGTIAQVIDIDEANLELTLSVDVSAHSNDTHPKVRRWDQPSAPVTVAAGPLLIEDGIQVSFAGNHFLTGDWWTFAARTMSGNIEPQPSTPLPGGITHYYVPLALVTWTVAGGVITAAIHDCRPTKPTGGCCCCSVTVGDGVQSTGDFTSIQEAIDSLANREQDVEVCLLPGRYAPPEPIIVRRGRLLIRGCGLAARVQAPPKGPTFLLSQVANVTFEEMNIFGGEAQPAIQVIAGTGIIARDSWFTAGRPGPWCIIAQTNRLLLERNQFISGGVWVVDGSANVRIRENDFTGGSGPGIGLEGLPFSIDFLAEKTGVVSVEITGNAISRTNNSGITTVVDGDNQPQGLGEVEDLIIARNTIVDCARQGPVSPYFPSAVAGILLHGARGVRIHQNHIANNGAVQGVPACGVFTQAVEELEISNNLIENNGAAVETINRICVDFRPMQARAIDNPFVLSGVTFTVSEGQRQLKTANLVGAPGAVALDCRSNTDIKLPSPTTSAELLLNFDISMEIPGTVVALAGDGSVVDTQAIPNATQSTVTLTSSSAIISTVRISASTGSTTLSQICFAAPPPQVCVDFRNMQAGQIANPSTFSGATFTVSDNVNVLPSATLVGAPGSVSLQCGAKTDVALPSPATSATLSLTFDVSFELPGTVQALAADGSVITTQQIPNAAQSTVTATSATGNISTVRISSSFGSTTLLEICFTAAAAGTFQGAIVAIAVSGLPALRVHDNVASAPAGHSLLVTGRGPMSVANNQLTSGGFRAQPTANLAMALVIVNVGRNFLLGNRPLGFLAAATTRLTVETNVTVESNLSDGRVLFEGNQVNFFPSGTLPKIRSVSFILTADDAAIQNNQFESVVPRASRLPFDVGSTAVTTRVSGNRFSETPLTAPLSYFGHASFIEVTNNQATHCVFATGLHVVLLNNQVMVNPSKCESLTNGLKTQLGGQ